MKGDVRDVRKVMSGFYVDIARPVGGLGQDGELASVRRSMEFVVCQVKVEEGAELDGVPLSSVKGEIDGRSIVIVRCVLVRSGGGRGAARGAR